MENKYNALSLRSVNYGESDKIVTLLTLERGRIAVKARGVRTAKAKLRYAVSPLCFGTYIIAERGGKGIITACDIVDTFDSAAIDLGKYYAAAVILECADKFSEEDVADSELFFLIIGALKELCYGVVEPWRSGIAFLTGLLKKIGYAISAEPNCVMPCCFDYDNGRLRGYSSDVKNCERVTTAEATLIAASCKESLPQGEFAEEGVKRFYLIIAEYIRSVTGKRLKTLEQFVRIM